MSLHHDILLAVLAAGLLTGAPEVDTVRATLSGHNAQSSDDRNAPLVKFHLEQGCTVPMVNSSTLFKGGTTDGEEVTVRLDTRHHWYEIEIDASRTPGRLGLRRHGTLLLNRDDCLYQLSGEGAAPLAVNKDGILFGGVSQQPASTAGIAIVVAFMHTSNDISDLHGDWWVFDSRHKTIGATSADGTEAPSESSAMPMRSIDNANGANVYQTRIQPDGRFSSCPVRLAGQGQCNANNGRIFFNGSVFVSEDEHGERGTLVVGQVAGKRVPILLHQNEHGSGMRFFAPHRMSAPQLPLLRLPPKTVPLPLH